MAKDHWIAHAAWQPLRRGVERMFVTRDWFELIVAQALVGDGLVYPLFYQQLDDWFARRHGPGLATVLDPLMRWHDETSKWVDAIVKVALAESPENRALIQSWIARWSASFVDALTPLAETAMGRDGAAALTAAQAALQSRLITLGLAG